MLMALSRHAADINHLCGMSCSVIFHINGALAKQKKLYLFILRQVS